MKIVHICLTGPYTDHWNYQENLITKFQVKAGHTVSLIASQWAWGTDGKTVRRTESDYVNEDGVKIIRLPIRGNRDIFYRYKRFVGFYENMEKERPDILFVHNLQFPDVAQICRYAGNYRVRIYADNHADFSNSARSRLARAFYKTVWRHYARMLEPYVTKFYGVLPARVAFLKEVYGLSPQKCELLVMGADDEEVERVQKNQTPEIREQFGWTEDDFLIVSGGKIDAFKKQTLYLMEAVKQLHAPKVRLLIFGSVAEELREQFNRLCRKDRIVYAGWATAAQSYDYFAAADLVVFPGRHSVYWEQVVGQGKPLLCKYWKGTAHIDIGGNVKFLYEDSVEAIKAAIQQLLTEPEQYMSLKRAAQQPGRSYFGYRSIAARAIEEAEGSPEIEKRC